MTKVNSLAQKSSEHSASFIENNRGNRIMYPAIVVPGGTDDSSEQNRIRARIVSFNEKTGKIEGNINSDYNNYNSFGGLDAAISDEDLVMCIPLFPQFFFSKPQVGEMVYVIIENPNDKSSVRYWVGPIITSKLKLSYQNYEDSIGIYDKTRFLNNRPLTNTSISVENIFPKDSDIAIQGRQDADLILKNREALLIAGKFNYKTFKINNESPSYLKLKQFNNFNYQETQKKYDKPTHTITVFIEEINGQYKASIVVKNLKQFVFEDKTNIYKQRETAIDFLKENLTILQKKYPFWEFINNDIDEFKNEYQYYYTILKKQEVNVIENGLNNFSIAELVSTALLLYSPNGKFRKEDMQDFEVNKDLETLGNIAKKLHPAVFGDELIKVLNLIIKLLLSHIHQPQNPLVQTALSNELQKYTIKGELQKIISNFIRIN